VGVRYCFFTGGIGGVGCLLCIREKHFMKRQTTVGMVTLVRRIGRLFPKVWRAEPEKA
jgi:hypothetical protein